MINPVAARLIDLLTLHKDCHSLLFTGHSAGGTIASLLYAHMLASSVKSELISLRKSFNRIHCLTFGAPPVSLYPLTTTEDMGLFISIIIEGDPVPRADSKYVQSLAALLLLPKPNGY